MFGSRRRGRRSHRAVADLDLVEDDGPLQHAVVVVLPATEEELGGGLEVEALANDPLLDDLDDVGRVAGDAVGARRTDVVGVLDVGMTSRPQSRGPELVPAVGRAVHEPFGADRHR